EYPKHWIESGVNFLSELVRAGMTEGPLKDLLLEGIISGVGGVIVFLPNILILFLFISLMEDTGYMARAAFIMDKIMHKMGLHGKSFIPLIMAFGCSVPAIQASRTIENKNSRFITILITPLMSCSARLPVYLLLSAAFFPHQAGLVLFGMYLTGIILAVMMAKLFKRFFFKSEDLPFVMELPPYRVPTLSSVLRHMWEKGYQYLKKIGSVILVASIIIWFLGYFPHSEAYAKNPTQETHREQQEQSYIGQIGHVIAPVLKPLGFDWKIGISLVSGVAAKEIVVSTLSVLYTDNTNSAGLPQRLRSDTYTDGSPVFTSAVALALMVFVLIYFPCVATLAAIKQETGTWKWALFEIVYTLALAWIVTFLVYQVALIFL
ncbi:MAG: ferrous iron transport protein B, partial [Bacteroidota bacterium]|nr:ferrous iron transport protein B [Bacteroidota bacterium]